MSVNARDMKDSIDLKSLESCHSAWCPSFRRRCDPVLLLLHCLLLESGFDAHEQAARSLFNDWSDLDADFTTAAYAKDACRYLLEVGYDRRHERLSLMIKNETENVEAIVRLAVDDYVADFRADSCSKAFKKDAIDALSRSLALIVTAASSVRAKDAASEACVPFEEPRSRDRVNDESRPPSSAVPRRFVDTVVTVNVETDLLETRPDSTARSAVDHRISDFVAQKRKRSNSCWHASSLKRRKLSADCHSTTEDSEASTRACTGESEAARPKSAPHHAVVKYTYNPIQQYTNYFRTQVKASVDEAYREMYGDLLAKHAIRPCRVDLFDCFKREPLAGMREPVVLDVALLRRLRRTK